MSVRGPWTPSTRSSSMSLVADGPLIMVSGATGSTRVEAGGHAADHLIGGHDAHQAVGEQGQRPPSRRR